MTGTCKCNFFLHTPNSVFNITCDPLSSSAPLIAIPVDPILLYMQVVLVRTHVTVCASQYCMYQAHKKENEIFTLFFHY